MVSFAIVLFFSVTGLTLNHTEWFANSEKTIRTTGQMPHAWLRPDGSAEPSKLEIVEHLRSVNKLHGAVSDFRTEDNQISVSFKAPGYSADAFIDRDSNRYDVIEVRNGFIAVINDLHSGRDSGKVWGWLIDASAILPHPRLPHRPPAPLLRLQTQNLRPRPRRRRNHRLLPHLPALRPLKITSDRKDE